MKITFRQFAATAIVALAVNAAPHAFAGPLDGVYDEDTSFNAQPAGLLFHQTLFKEYQKLSSDRDHAWFDRFDAELFNHKALLASTRTAVQHDAVTDRKLGEEQKKVFTQASDRFYAMIEKGGRELAPIESATAQVAYDCWIEASEDKRGDDAQSCKAKFDDAMKAAEEKATYQLGQVRVAEQPAPAPTPAPVAAMPPKEYYIVTFEFDKTTMTPDGERVLAQAIRDTKDLTQLKIALRAHADRAGPNDYNLKLSRRRAEAVLNRMSSAGVSQDRLRIVQAVGESKSLVPTADGVREASNRVVEIDLRQ